MLGLLAALWTNVIFSAEAQNCEYTMDNHCDDGGKLLSYECVPQATTCCIHAMFSDSACVNPVPDMEHMDSYIIGSCRTEGAKWLDETKCEAPKDKEDMVYYHMMDVSGEGSSLKYCIQEFADSDCLVSKGDRECMSTDPSLNDRPLEACFPEEGNFLKITCGACSISTPPTTPAPESLSPNGVANGSIKWGWGSVVLIPGIINMAVGLQIV
jgi:hypothetical protein